MVDRRIETRPLNRVPDPHDYPPAAEAHQGCGLRTRPGRRHDFTETGSHAARISASAVQASGIPTQERLLRLPLPIVEILVVGKTLGQFHNMDYSGHIRVSQANKLEVAGRREMYGIGRRIWRGQQDSRVQQVEPS